MQQNNAKKSRNHIRIAVFFVSCGLAFGVSSAEPEYDCTALETKQYIEQVSHGLFSPSPITSPEQFKKAFVERQQAAAAGGDGDAESCVTIFGDGSLSDEWKRAVDAIRNLQIDIDLSGINGAALKKILEEAQKRISEQVSGALEKMGEDICELLSSDNIKGIVLDGVNEKYGLNARQLRMKNIADSMTEEMMDDAPKNIKLLTDGDEIVDTIDGETKKKLRKARKDLWDNF